MLGLPLWAVLIVVGVIALVVDYFVTAAPPPVHQLLKAVGWILIIVGIIVLVVALLGGGIR